MSGATAVFRFGEFTFDCGSRLLLRGGERLHLSPKAQQLLRLLLMAHPRALSREELYDALWPETYVSETNLATVVNEVRRALGEPARASQYIRTVHGFGYAFDGAVRAVSGSRRVAVAATLSYGGVDYPLLEGENVIGRARDSAIVLAHGSVSRRHAVIRVHGSTITVQDLGSTNGTYVNGSMVDSTPVQLPANAQFVLGTVIVTLKAENISSTARLQLDMPELRREVNEIMARSV